LGLPTWSDKLVGEVVRLLLEAYYEPTFSDWTAPAKLEAGSLGSQPARGVAPRDRWNASSYSRGGMFPQ
jgi:hypothetical protein